MAAFDSLTTSLSHLSLASRLPSEEEILSAIRDSKAKGYHEPLQSIVKNIFSSEEFFSQSSMRLSPVLVFKAVSQLVKSGNDLSSLRPAMQKCLRLAIMHLQSPLATPEEKEYWDSRKTIEFQCPDGNHSINQLLFRLSFPEYWKVLSHFTQASKKDQSTLTTDKKEASESTSEGIPLSVAAIEFLHHWLLQNDYEAHCGNLTYEHGLDLLALGEQFLSPSLHQRAFDLIRSHLGAILDTRGPALRAPEVAVQLLAGQALSGAKTSPFFLRLTEEIKKLPFISSIEEMIQQMIGRWNMLTQEQWERVLDYQDLRGHASPLFRSYLEIQNHKNAPSLEGALCRTVLATGQIDSTIEVCVGYSSDTRKDMLINQAIHTLLAHHDGEENSPFSQVLFSTISPQELDELRALKPLLRKHDSVSNGLCDRLNRSAARCVRPMELSRLLEDDSLAGRYLQAALTTKSLRILVKESEDLPTLLHLMETQEKLRAGVATIVIEYGVSVPKDFPKTPAIPASVEMVLRTGLVEKLIPRDRDLEQPTRFVMPQYYIEDYTGVGQYS